jgi:hypothetical protein
MSAGRVENLLKEWARRDARGVRGVPVIRSAVEW